MDIRAEVEKIYEKHWDEGLKTPLDEAIPYLELAAKIQCVWCGRGYARDEPGTHLIYGVSRINCFADNLHSAIAELRDSAGREGKE